MDGRRTRRRSPTAEKPKHPITVRNVLSHTSGCRSNRRSKNRRSTCFRWPSACRSYAMTPLEFEPDTQMATIPTPASTPPAASSKSSAACPTRLPGQPAVRAAGHEGHDVLAQRASSSRGWPNRTSRRPNKIGLGRRSTIGQLKYPLDDRASPADAGRRFVLDGQRPGPLLPDGLRTAASSRASAILSEAAVKQMTSKQTGELAQRLWLRLGDWRRRVWPRRRLCHRHVDRLETWADHDLARPARRLSRQRRPGPRARSSTRAEGSSTRRKSDRPLGRFDRFAPCPHPNPGRRCRYARKGQRLRNLSRPKD